MRNNDNTPHHHQSCGKPSGPPRKKSRWMYYTYKHFPILVNIKTKDWMCIIFISALVSLEKPLVTNDASKEFFVVHLFLQLRQHTKMSGCSGLQLSRNSYFILKRLKSSFLYLVSKFLFDFPSFFLSLSREQREGLVTLTMGIFKWYPCLFSLLQRVFLYFFFFGF